MRIIFLLFIPCLFFGQNQKRVSLYAEYQKTRPVYRRMTQELYFSGTDGQTPGRVDTETWLPFEHKTSSHVNIRRDKIIQDREYCLVYSASKPDEVTTLCWMGGKASDTTIQIRTGDTLRTWGAGKKLLSMTVYYAKDSSSASYNYGEGGFLKTVTVPEPGKTRKFEYSNDTLRMSTVYYGKENRYDSVVSYQEKGEVFLRTSYRYNAQGDVEQEEEKHPGDVYTARCYLTTYVYKYDGKNNWIEKTTNRRSCRAQIGSSDQAPHELIWVYKRSLEY